MMSTVSGFQAPASVQMVRWVRDPFGLLERGRAEFGDTFTMRLPRLPGAITILADPDAVKDVFALGSDEAHAGKGNRLILKQFLGEHSLLLLDGREHQRHRKMMVPAFHGERMQAYGATMLRMTHDAIDRMPLGEVFPMKGVTQDITLQVILRTVFGIEQGARFVELADVLTRVLDAGVKPILFFPGMQRDYGRLSPWARYKALLARTEAILRDEIRRGRATDTRGRTDVLAMMLEARDETGAVLTEDEVHDELLTLLVAGHETTATALAWALRWILPDRSLLGRLRDEIAGASGDPTRLAKLELLDGTVKEALRLQPVVPNVARVLQKPARLGGRDYPAGSIVAPSIYLVHRNRSLYPDPEQFRPERFLRFKPAAWEWLPFGGGLRRCIGAAFALYEMKMVLAALLPRVEMRLASDDVRPMRRGVTVAPSKGLEVVMTAKRSREGWGRRAS
jgi:cytochrome P450